MSDQETHKTSATPEAPPTGPAALPPPERLWWWGTGRRKTAVARVRVRNGSGKFMVNGREINDYFGSELDRKDVVAPLRATGCVNKVDVFANVLGGGPTGQAGAILLGLARALRRADEKQFLAPLREGGFLTRDSRMVERKKYGRAGARRRFQFSKR